MAGEEAMPKPSRSLAKLSLPRLYRPVPRERLFAMLDDTRATKTAICVVGPPGAGKTTLVGSWLDARSIRSIWYQMDAGDANLPTFFFHLRESAQRFSRSKRRPLQLLTPEYLSDIDSFSRRFFRDFFARLPDGVTLVFDNFQEVPSGEPFHRLFSQAVEETPSTVTVIVISRRDPPTSYARLLANTNVAIIDGKQLKLTLEETRTIVHTRVGSTIVDIDHLYRRSDGWVAGLVLMLERRARDAPDATDIHSLRDVFNYFAAELFSQFDDPKRKRLSPPPVQMN
jgi:LuxR family transcriptional regulator, maltose regulon positive regulatory protein